MTDGNVLFIQRNDVTKRAFFDSSYVCLVITTLLLYIVINGPVAGIFLLFSRMQRLLKRVKYLVETVNLHISREVQKQKQQSGKYPNGPVLN